MHDAKTPSDSRVTTHAIMFAQHANHLGHVHGGHVMKLVDEAGGLAAMRHSRRPVVTVAVDGMVFHHPILTNSVLQIEATVVATGRTSMEVEVFVRREDPVADTLQLVHSAAMVYVALGEDHRPCPVPPLELRTEEDKAANERALERKARRGA